MRSGVRFSIASISSSPSIILVKKSTPTARTSGSANGSLIKPRGSLDAMARPTATKVAVAPTLDARSQLSSWARGMENPSQTLRKGRGDIAHVAEGGCHLVLGKFKPIARIQLLGGMGCHLPTVGGQVVDDDAALAPVEQVGRVEVEPEALPPLADALQTLVGERVGVGHVFGGQPA